MRTIDADELQEEYKKQHDGKRSLLIDVAPTVEPQRMRGRWIGCDNSDHWKCSVCGTRAAFWFSEETSSELELDMSEWLSDFCPNCGCQMNGDEEDEQ